MKKLDIDALLKFTKSKFDKFKDTRADNIQYQLGDVVQSGLAIFSLKDSSLLEFNKRIPERAKNLKRIYKINRVPPDGQMREILDEVKPIQIERVKKAVIGQVKKADCWKNLNIFEAINYS